VTKGVDPGEQLLLVESEGLVQLPVKLNLPLLERAADDVVGGTCARHPT